MQSPAEAKSPRNLLLSNDYEGLGAFFFRDWGFFDCTKWRAR